MVGTSGAIVARWNRHSQDAGPCPTCEAEASCWKVFEHPANLAAHHVLQPGIDLCRDVLDIHAANLALNTRRRDEDRACADEA